MNFWVVGYGRMGRKRSQIAVEHRLVLKGIHDASFPQHNHRELLRPVEGDVVFICTPPGAVSQYLGLPGRKFVEKPFYDESVWVGWSHRYHPQIAELRKREPAYLELVWTRNKGIPGGWFSETSNAWEDIGSHLVDLATYICRGDAYIGAVSLFDFSKGDIKYRADWWGETESWNYASQDSAVALFMVNDTPCLVRVSWASPEPEQFRISGYDVNGYFAYDIDPMADNIFEKEVEDFLKGEPQEVYRNVL